MLETLTNLIVTKIMFTSVICCLMFVFPPKKFNPLRSFQKQVPRKTS
jgi:hypothetical protein